MEGWKGWKEREWKFQVQLREDVRKRELELGCPRWKREREVVVVAG